MPRPVDSSDLDRFGAGLRQEIHVSSEDVRAHVGRVIADLRQEIRETTAAILERVDASTAETRRHFERFRGEVREDFGKVDRRLLHLEVRVIGRSDPT